MVDVLVMSDSHCMLPEHDLAADVAIHCGDWGNRGTQRETDEFLSWFSDIKAPAKVAIVGNHDSFCARYAGAASRMAERYGIHLVTHCSYFKIGQFSVLAAAYRDHREGSTKHAWQILDEGADLLFTHSPPHGIFDMNLHGKPIGCRGILKWVRRHRPMAHFFGHCHEHCGKSVSMERTMFYNISAQDRATRLPNNHFDEQKAICRFEGPRAALDSPGAVSFRRVKFSAFKRCGSTASTAISFDRTNSSEKGNATD